MKKRIVWMGLSFLLVATLVLGSCAEGAPGEQEKKEEEEEEVLAPPRSIYKRIQCCYPVYWWY